MDSYIKGIFKKTIFMSDNGYVVGLFRVKETNNNDIFDFVNKTITITGYFHEITIDENYIMHGEIVENPKYGIQFKVNEYERIAPEGKDAVIEFLSSGLFSGIGEKTAKQIVDTLGEDTLRLIEEDYSNLLMVPNMKQEKALKIHETLNKYNESYNIIVYLNDIGFTTKDSLSIYNILKDNTTSIINGSIYTLIDLVPEINFNKIEKVRKKLEIDDNDKNRIMYGIISVFKSLCFNLGDTYVELDDLLPDVVKLLNIELSLEDLEYYIYELQKEGKIRIVGKKLFLTEYYNSEVYVSDILYYLTNKKDSKYKSINNDIESVEMYFDIKYNKNQKLAIKNSIIKNFNIITGGPGTGKTTIIKGIIEVYRRVHKLTYMDMVNKMALLAPTGRAAKRMGEAALMPASTIHRFLKWNKDTDTFMVNDKNKSDVDFVIIDEVSMIDTVLLCNLLKGLKKDVKIVMIGDYNQLESVGPGKVLKDLIDSDMVNVIKLDELYRQKNDSYIATLAKEIRDNNFDIDFNKKADFNFIESESYNIKGYIKELVKKAIEKGYDSSDIQVLAPMYKGENGIDNLNKILQEVFNPDIGQDSIKYLDVTYRVDDKVLKLENDPDNNVFNGDIGYITKIEDKEITIDFDGTVVHYNYKDFNTIKHGYAISVHKSQGSEFKIVIMPVTSSYRIMLYKKLIYTGITRAKQSLIIVGSKEAFLYSLGNTGGYERRTNLKECLFSCINTNSA